MKSVRLISPVNGIPRDISSIGFGGSQIGSIGSNQSSNQVIELLDEAVDLGINCFDTASIYGQGDSETALGKLARRRSNLFIVTKYGGKFSAKMRLIRPLKPILRPVISWLGADKAVVAQRTGNLDLDFSRDHLQRSVVASLRRLRTERLDALLMHSPAAAVLDDSRTMDALLDIREHGLAEHVGVSVDDVATLIAAARFPWVTIVQATLSVLDSPSAQQAAAAIRARGGLVLIREVIAERGERSPLEAIGRAVARPDGDVVLVRTSRVDHLREIVAAANPPSTTLGGARRT